jgi:glyoxylase I family protein
MAHIQQDARELWFDLNLSTNRLRRSRVRACTGGCARLAHDRGGLLHQTRVQYRLGDFSTQTEMSMAPTAAALEERTTTPEDDGMKQIRHRAHACWDSEETRHFYEDILEMPLIAAVVIEEPFRNDGSGTCYTFFGIGDGDTLVFFEQMSLAHPKYFNARSACHRHVAFEVGADATVQQFKRKLDAAGIANTLNRQGTSRSLRFHDPNGLILEFTTEVRRSSEYARTSRSSAHSELQRWLLQRQNWWRRRPVHENYTTSRSAAM